MALRDLQRSNAVSKSSGKHDPKFPQKSPLEDGRQSDASNSTRARTARRAYAGRPTPKLDDLRKKVRALGEEQLEEFRETLNWVALEILQRRGINVPPETRISIAESLSVSKKTIGRTEGKLLANLTAFLEEHGVSPENPAPRARTEESVMQRPIGTRGHGDRRQYAAANLIQLDELIKKAAALGKEQVTEFQEDLTWMEVTILCRRGLNLLPETHLVIAESLSVSLSKTIRAEKSLLAKLSAFLEKRGVHIFEDPAPSSHGITEKPNLHGKRQSAAYGVRFSPKLNELRKKAAALGNDQLKEFQEGLDWVELEILQRRALNVPPELQLIIAESLSVSNKTIGRVEERLIAKLTAFLERSEGPSSQNPAPKKLP